MRSRLYCNLLCAFNYLQPMKKFVFSVASRATGHSRPQSPSFLGHVIGKRGALDAAVTGCQKISDIRLRMCKSYKYHCSCSQRIFVPRRSFLSPEPVVSWSRGRETRGYKLSRVALGTRMICTVVVMSCLVNMSSDVMWYASQSGHAIYRGSRGIGLEENLCSSLVFVQNLQF